MATEQLKLEHQMCFTLYTASRMVVQAYGPLLKDHNLTYTQYLVLLVLWEEEEEVTVSTITEKLLLETSTVTPTLKRLEKDGWVNRERSKKDERKVIITLTEKGKLLEKSACKFPDLLWGSVSIDPMQAIELKKVLDRFIHDQKVIV